MATSFLGMLQRHYLYFLPHMLHAAFKHSWEAAGDPGCYSLLGFWKPWPQRSKLAGSQTSLWAHWLSTRFLQIHALLFTWSLLLGWLSDTNSTIAGLLSTFHTIQLSITEFFILCFTSHVRREPKHPCSIPSLSTQCECALFSLARWMLSRDHLIREGLLGKDKEGPQVENLPFRRISSILHMQMT